MSDKLAFTAVILAGGKSSRMGKDKALLPFAGKTMLENIVELVHSIFDETLIIVNDRSKAKGLHLYEARVYEDLIKNRGPLGGIYTGLLYSKNVANCVFPCDMPFIDELLIRDLIDFWQEDVDALCFEDPKGDMQPFPGIYNRALRFLVRTLLDHGETSMRHLMEVALVKPIILKKEKIEVLFNMNRIEDYYEVLKEKEGWVKK